MTYAVSFHVGSKYGAWLTGRERFATEAEARQAIDADRADEHRAGASKFTRRVVRV